MKIYIAGPWVDRAKMPEVASLVEGLGHQITHKWWEHKDIGESEGTAQELRVQAEKDKEGVESAQLLIVINSAKSEGKAVEQGVALALGKPILIVGKRGDGTSKNVFHYLDNYYWVENLNELTKALETIQWMVSFAG